MPTHVYFVQAETLGLIKIGVACDIRLRLTALQCGSPDRLKLLGCAPDPEPLLREQQIHRMFRGDWSHGEWFRPSPDLLAFIAAVLEPAPVLETPPERKPRVVRRRGIGLMLEQP